MKVTNNRIGSPTPQMESDKLGKTGGTGPLSKDIASSTGMTKEAKAQSAQVDVSERAQMMQKAKDLASRPDTVDEAKVARLQKLIDDGKYKIDADAIADRLVDEHLTIPD